MTRFEPAPLPAWLNVGTFAMEAVSAASHAAAALAGTATLPLSPDAVAAAFTSDHHLRIDGAAPQAFAPLSGFFRSADGWVRTHANYPWHRSALLEGLALGAGDDADVPAALMGRTSAAIAAGVTAAGGLAVPVAAAVDTQLARIDREPLVRAHRIGAGGAPLARNPTAPSAPLAGVRVLDLTRVIAGPVATRTLALLGADVLRVDPPGRPEIAWQHLDTGHGKRTTVLDAASEACDALASTADVIVTGYRPGSLEARGFDPVRLADRRPGLVVARLRAWTGPGRGFDSLVQAASGIAMLEARGRSEPAALPAQALDHAAGYHLVAAIMRALSRRDSGAWLLETSLVRMAAALVGRGAGPAMTAQDSIAVPTQAFDVAGVTVSTVRPALAFEGAPERFAPPRPWGSDEPAWLPR